MIAIVAVIQVVFQVVGGGNVSCADEGVDRFTKKIVTTTLFGTRVEQEISVVCRGAPGDAVEAEIAVEPEDPDVTQLEEPLICTVDLEIDGTTIEGAETTIREFGEQVLVSAEIPEDAPSGPATSVVSCEQAGELVIVSEQELFIEEALLPAPP